MENSDLIPLCVPQTWLRQLDLHLTLDSKKLPEEKKNKLVLSSKLSECYSLSHVPLHRHTCAIMLAESFIC